MRIPKKGKIHYDSLLELLQCFFCVILPNSNVFFFIFLIGSRESGDIFFIKSETYDRHIYLMILESDLV